MRLYLHIGLPKTGSTAIQRFFKVNRDALEERGVLYPLSGRPKKPGSSTDSPRLNHHPLALEILSPPEDVRDSAWPELLAELRGAKEDVALVSSEVFDYLRADSQFAAVRSHLQGLDVKVIVYVRRQDEYLASYYCQWVYRRGESHRFEEFRRLPVVEANYQKLLSRWEEAFGREALIVRPYERSALVNGDVIDDICAQIGVNLGAEATRPPPGKVVNPTYPRNVINCVRMARQAGMDDDQLAALRDLFKRIYFGRKTESDYLSPTQRTQLLGEFGESNRAVAKRYLGREDGVLFEDLELPDQAAWEERYSGGPLADVMLSIADAQKALSRRVRPSARGAPGSRSGIRAPS